MAAGNDRLRPLRGRAEIGPQDSAFLEVQDQPRLGCNSLIGIALRAVVVDAQFVKFGQKTHQVGVPETSVSMTGHACIAHGAAEQREGQGR